MPRFELSTRIAASASDAWSVLSDVANWSEWSTLVTCESGELSEGSTLQLANHGKDGTSRLSPLVIRVTAPREFVLRASVGKLGLLEMVHTLRLEDVSADECELRQSWVASGLLARVLWPRIGDKMARYERLGADLATRLAGD